MKILQKVGLASSTLFVVHLNQQLLVNGQLLQLHVLLFGHVATSRGVGAVGGGAVGRSASSTAVPVIQFGGQVQDRGKVQKDGGRQLGAQPFAQPGEEVQKQGEYCRR